MTHSLDGEGGKFPDARGMVSEMPIDTNSWTNPQGFLLTLYDVEHDRGTFIMSP